MSDGKSNIVVIGLGNAYRGDDAVGLLVAELCGGQEHTSIRVHTSVSDATSLLNLWANADLCVVVDCAVSGSPAGTIHRFDGLIDSIPAQFSSSFSTHALSIGQGLELGRVLKQLPQRLLIFGIEGECFLCGASMSPVVKEAAMKVSESILQEIDALALEAPFE